MRRALVPLLAASLWFAGCEDGPDQVFTPNTGEPAAENGHAPSDPFFQEGSAGYTSTAGGGDDNVGRARFCSEAENTKLVEQLVQEPIIPDVSMGGVPMRNPDETPIHADQLVGVPIVGEDGRYVTGQAMLEQGGGMCDPTVYSNALTWGPTNEIVAFINTDTYLLETLLATQDFKGEMSVAGEMTIKLRERMILGDVELDQYSSQATQASKPRSWLNHENINAMYRVIRGTWFGQESIDPEYDCVASKVCAIIYSTEEAQEVKQTTLLYFIDSGVVLVFAAEGEIIQLQIEPVRVAPFETSVSLAFGEEGADTVSPALSSAAVPGCDINLGEELTWGQFKSRCIQPGDTKTLERVSYDVYTQRNGVSVAFNGVNLDFTRTVSERGVLRDGERPHDEDRFSSMTVTRTLNAPVAEFVPADLAAAYKIAIEERIHAAVTVPEQEKSGHRAHDHIGNFNFKADDDKAGGAGGEEAGGAGGEEAGGAGGAEAGGAGGAEIGGAGGEAVEPAPLHPFLAFEVEVPDTLSAQSGPIEQLFYEGPNGTANWNNTVIQQVRALYDSLTPEQRAMVDPNVIEPTWLIEPYVEVVLEAFSHGQSSKRDAYTVLRNTDDRRWVIGYTNFIQDDVPYRIVVQYSLNYGAVTAITTGFGFNEIDDILQSWNLALRPNRGLVDPPYPYYSVDLALNTDNALGLNGDGIKVIGFDRQLGTLDIEVAKMTGSGPELVTLTVAGDPIEDRNGYMRQIRGQRYEFVPANVVRLSGLETGMLLYVEADGKIGRAGMGNFKQPMSLCPGLRIRYGDDIRDRITQWIATRGTDAYRECEILFNYSENGNVLDAVTSLTNRISFVTVNGRAIQTDVWR